MHVLRSIIQMFIADLYHCNVCDKIKRNMLMLEGAYWNYSLLIFFLMHNSKFKSKFVEA